MYYAYVLQSLRDGSMYYGSSENPLLRLEMYHNKGFEKYTRSRMPWKLIYSEEFVTRSEAVRRENFFKSGKGREHVKKILKDKNSM